MAIRLGTGEGLILMKRSRPQTVSGMSYISIHPTGVANRQVESSTEMAWASCRRCSTKPQFFRPTCEELCQGEGGPAVVNDWRGWRYFEWNLSIAHPQMRSLRDGENDLSESSGKREAAVVTGSVLLNVNHILYVVSMYPVQIAKLLIPPKWTPSPSGCPR